MQKEQTSGRTKRHRRLGHRLLPPFATKGRGENLLKVNSRENEGGGGGGAQKEKGVARNLRKSVSPSHFYVLSWLKWLCVAADLEFFNNEQRKLG